MVVKSALLYVCVSVFLSKKIFEVGVEEIVNRKALVLGL